jgi:aryl sulfotransferase
MPLLLGTERDVSNWPVKKRELVNVHLDSTVWNDFRFRAGDVVIASWGKSGCTWLQQIVGQLVLPEAQSRAIAEVSPWMELALQNSRATLALLERQQHRRILKTHLPVDALVYSPNARYLFMARSGRDVVWSLFNHFQRLTPTWYEMIRVRKRFGAIPAGPPNDFRAFFRQWLAEDGYPFWPFWDNVRSWWEIQGLPNLCLVHFRELKEEPTKTIDRIAQFLGVQVDADRRQRISERCAFGYMQANAEKIVQYGDIVFSGGAEAFFNKGENNGWRGLLSKDELDEYESARARYLCAECARWLDGTNDR